MRRELEGTADGPLRQAGEILDGTFGSKGPQPGGFPAQFRPALPEACPAFAQGPVRRFEAPGGSLAVSGACHAGAASCRRR